MRLNSIRARLTLWCVVVLAVTVTGYSIVLALSLARGLEAGVDHVLSEAARQATVVVEATATEGELEDEIRHLNVHTVVGVYDATNGRLLAGRQLAVPLDLPSVLQRSSVHVETQSLPDGATWRVWTQVVASPGKPDRVLVIGRSSTFVQISLTELLMIIGVSAPFVLLVALVGGIFLASRALNPIDQITRTAEAISAEDLSGRLGPRRANDEVGRLAATFDHMLDRLDRAFERQRRFTADASHELRTPLAMLVSRAGMALERRRSDAEYEEILRAVRDEGLQMGRIVNDLLLLARADAGSSLSHVERLDTGEILVSVADALRPIAEESGVTLNVLPQLGVQVVGDQMRLTQLMLNLVDNALAHTPRGGSIEMCARFDSGAAVLEVNDTGSGIAPEHLPHVFERFYRGPNDRRPERAGAGLGLALCRSIVLAHGGTIDLQSDAGHGTRAAIRLPLAAGIPL